MSLTKASYSMVNGAPINVLDYGADPTGATDSAPAIRLALAAGNAIYFPTGNYLVNSTISITPLLMGKTLFADGGMDSPTATIWCKNITGYLFTFDTTPGVNISGFALRGLSFDGSNGETNSQIGDYTKGSSTWQGVFKNTTGAIFGTGFALEVFVTDCTVSWSLSETAAFDLRGVFFNTLDTIRIQGFVNGYGIFLGGGVTGTTFTFRKLYFLFCRECVAVINGATDVQLYDCVFDSVLIAASILITKTLFSGCYFENIGYDITGEARSGLTPKSFYQPFEPGVLDTPVISALNIAYAPVLFNSCFFNFYSEIDANTSWIYALGRGALYAGGCAEFRLCYGSGQRFIETVDATEAVTENFKINWFNSANSTGGDKNGLTYADIRQLSSGEIPVAFPAFNPSLPENEPTFFQILTVTAGRFIVTMPTYQDYDIPTNSPSDGQWEIGDTIYIKTPLLGGNLGNVCIESGTPGSWAPFGLIGQTITSVTSNLANINESINTVNKYIGKTVFDESTNKLMTAAGNTPGGLWYAADGVTVITPV
jgi:hypothetical protein